METETSQFYNCIIIFKSELKNICHKWRLDATKCIFYEVKCFYFNI